MIENAPHQRFVATLAIAAVIQALAAGVATSQAPAPSGWPPSPPPCCIDPPPPPDWLRPKRACETAPVAKLEDVRLETVGNARRLIVRGWTSRAGWREIRLVYLGFEPDPAGRPMAIFEMVGCRPAMAAEVITPAQASIPLDLPSRIHRLQVRSASDQRTIDFTDPSPR